MIMYRFKMMPSGVRLENFLNIFGKNMSIENFNVMPSEVRQKFLNILFYLSAKEV